MAPTVPAILEPTTLGHYLDVTRLRPPPNEAAAVGGSTRPGVLRRSRAGRDLEQRVAAVYRSLSENERRQTAIIASNYGEAAAIDVYDRSDGLPALSGENQYFLWGTHGFDGDIVIHINGDPRRWRKLCKSVETAASFGASHAL